MTWWLISLCLLISFVFSGIEAGILSVNRVRLAHRAKLRDKAAIKLSKMLKTPHRLLVTVLIVTNLARIFALVLLTQELVRQFGNLGYLYALAMFLPVALIGLEFLPKSLFRRFPYRALAVLAEPLRMANLLLSPLHFIGEFVYKFAARNRAPDRQKLFIAREDFKFLTAESERTGVLTKTEREMIHNVVDFRSVLARDIMINVDPKRLISPETTVDELLSRSEARRQDRWLLMDAKKNISGMVSVFEVLLERRRNVPVSVYQRRHVTVDVNEPAYRVLRKLRAARTTLALVSDEDEKPVGLIVWEDIIRRLVM